MIKSCLYRIIVAVVSLLTAHVVSAQYFVYEYDEGPKHFLVDMDLGLNTDGYECNIGFSWWPVDGIGFKLAIGLAGEIREFSHWDWWYDDYYYDDYYYDDDYDYLERFKFMPSIEMRSPTLFSCSGGDTTFHLFANPGVCLSPGGAGSHDAQWFSWQLRGGLEADINREIVIALGYGYSNYNLYSGNPYSHFGDDYEHYRHTNSFFVTFGYRF